MTKRKKFDRKLAIIGDILRSKRLELSLEKRSREFFLEDRISKGLLEESSISIETLKNIENGKTMPTLSTLKVLSVALEVDFHELIDKIYEYI
ncbi:MAG: helix-turn-helix transcriptional regulator [Streptococcus salivarius]|uniref:helix-turn-helix domain-containing protein n=1 Tax=Streptococcus TaxID=1301 RepID=UPI0009C3D7A3|nr:MULTISPECIES: helix-turn-helix transcriptional regulator [Streptococcus]ARC33397.1 XRE family transcriptional regulator [Streptococcus equinus]MBS5181308.1 helix-turn-helix transcriptional regulator [Streptococcus salivarius]MDU2933654.1 helix-turn-helix transcriptional regulator [Streptococcus salivarius]MDU5766433.1 helix-turn-helix transcriptional regulator [Streptococcus salivarius]